MLDTCIRSRSARFSAAPPVNGGAAGFYRMRWMMVVLVTVLKLPSPEYTADTRWVPAARALVEYVAWPVGVSAVGAPTFFPSTRNWTVPVGVPAPGAAALTVAVNVTFVVRVTGLPLLVTSVLLEALFTVWVMALVLGM